ncbi:unnamed protein product [Umbelopsis vinacea]
MLQTPNVISSTLKVVDSPTTTSVCSRSPEALLLCLVSLIYLHRLKLRLPRYARGDYDTPYRLFLAAILTSSKFMSEGGTGLTSQMISQITDGLYTAKDVNLMERSFLGLMRYELWVDVDEVKLFLQENGSELEMELREVVMQDGVDWWKEL